MRVMIEPWFGLAILLMSLRLGAAAAEMQPATAPPIPELSIPICLVAPRLDGVLDDVCWQTAAPITNLHIVGEAGKTSGRYKVYVIRDNAWVYVGFRVIQAVSERNPPTFRKHDEEVQSEDNVQVSFDPGTDGQLYYQFLLSPLNVRADFRMTRAGGRDREDWNIPWRSATKQDDQGWYAEIALPLSLLMAGGNLAKARFNVLADAFVVQRDACAAQVGIKREESSWAPLKIHFHEPEQFGYLRGMTKQAITTPFLPFFSEVKISPYRMADNKFYYDVRSEVRDMGKQGGQVKLSVEDKPSQGPSRKIEQTLDIKCDGTGQTFSLAVPVDIPGKRTAVLSLGNAAGEVWQSVLLDETAALDLFSAYLDRNYYTAEKKATAMCRIGLPAEGLKGMVLQAKGPNGKTLAKAQNLQPVMSFGIPLADLAIGEQRITLELCRADASVLTRQEVALLKRAPKSGCEWKIDRVNRILLKDGMPFFPFGFVMESISATDDWAFEDVAEMGINSIQNYLWNIACSNENEVAANARSYLDTASKYNLQVLLTLDVCYSTPVSVDDPEGILTPDQLKRLQELTKTRRGSNLTALRTSLVLDPILKPMTVTNKGKMFFQIYEKQLPYFMAAVKAAKSVSNLIGYNIFDEPNISGLNQDIAGRHYNGRIHENDGYHPVITIYNTLWDTSEYRTRSTDWCDVLMQDPYWIPAGGRNRPAQSVINYVAGMVARTKRLADSARCVTMTMPHSEFWGGDPKRSLLPAEQRCQTYLALIHGSKGIIYYRYPLYSPSMAAMLKQLAQEMKVLGPICLEPDVEQQVVYLPGELDPFHNKFTDIQVVLRHNPAGGYVLLCANTAYYPVDTTLTVALLGDKGEVSRLFSDQKYHVSGHSFMERIEGFGTRAYVIQMQNAEYRIKQTVMKWWKRADLIRGQQSAISNRNSKFRWP